MTVYQLVQALVMTAGVPRRGRARFFESTEGGGGPSRMGYAAIFILTSGMRVVTLFMLASIEPSGLLRHRARRVLVDGVPVPGFPGGSSARRRIARRRTKPGR